MKAWQAEKVGFHQIFELLYSEVIGQKYSFNSAFVYLNQFKTFIHAILFWLTHERHRWNEIILLYWRCFGLEVMDIIFRWFESNPLLQSLQMNSMGLGCRLNADLTREDMLILLYGHLKPNFWSHAIQKARVASKDTSDWKPEETNCDDVNLGNPGTSGPKTITMNSDILSQTKCLIHSKLWINNKYNGKMVPQPSAAKPIRTSVWLAKPQPILISVTYRNSILPCLPLLFNDLSDECKGFIPVTGSVKGKGKVYDWLNKVEERDAGSVDESKELERWKGPELKEEIPVGDRRRGKDREDETRDLLTRDDGWSISPENVQNGNAADDGGDASNHKIGFRTEAR